MYDQSRNLSQKNREHPNHRSTPAVPWFKFGYFFIHILKYILLGPNANEERTEGPQKGLPALSRS